MSKFILSENSLLIDGKKVIQISAGYYYSLFLVETGEVYSCGNNSYGQLGRNVASGSPTSVNLGLIPDLSNIIQISGGSSCSLFLNSSGQVYSCGVNLSGQLGRNIASGSSTATNLGVISSLSNITQISTGNSYSLFLNSSKKVYSCGDNSRGQLGRNIASGSSTATNLGVISSLSNITQISAECIHSLFLNSSGQVYSCGYNVYGELGRNVAYGSETTTNLGLISDLSNITQISTGYDYSLFLNSSGQVYNCGNNDNGQLGRNIATGSKTSVNLGLISDLSSITKISANYYHSLFLNSSGQVYSCGFNTYGQLGRIVANGSATATNLGMILDLSNITQISGETYHSLFLNSSNQVYSCGYNNYGQLGRNVSNGSSTVSNLEMILGENFN
jgi:alpha-tubulin suppressor-like RCC1 family protein